MLVLSRKVGETIVIGSHVTVTVARVSGSRVFLTIEAPANIRVDREEIWCAKNGGIRRASGIRRAPGDCATAGPEKTKQG